MRDLSDSSTDTSLEDSHEEDSCDSSDSPTYILETLMASNCPENSQDMEVFLNYCDQANLCVAEEEKTSLLDYIKSKISGRAAEQLPHHEFANWEELREWLRTFYDADTDTDHPNYDEKLCQMDLQPLRFEICAILLFNDDMDYVEMRSIKARNNQFRLMIDTGSSVNLIKMTSITPDVEIDSDEKILLTNISLGDHFETAGSCWIPLIVDNKRFCVKFYVMEQRNNVPGDGILGTEFMEAEKVTINYGDRTICLNTINKILDMHRT